MIYNKKHYSKRVGIKSKEEALTHRGISHRRPTSPAKRTTGGESPPPTLATQPGHPPHTEEQPQIAESPIHTHHKDPHIPQRPAYTRHTKAAPQETHYPPRTVGCRPEAESPIHRHHKHLYTPGTRKQHNKRPITPPPTMGCRPGSRE